MWKYFTIMKHKLGKAICSMVQISQVFGPFKSFTTALNDNLKYKHAETYFHALKMRRLSSGKSTWRNIKGLVFWHTDFDNFHIQDNYFHM